MLDASALLCLVFDEPGAEKVEAAFEGRAVVGAVNWAEVLSKVADLGGDPGEMIAQLDDRGLLDDVLQVVELTAVDGLAIARLRPRTRDLGLSLGDRACLALAHRLGLPALTCDRAWAHLDAGVVVELAADRADFTARGLGPRSFDELGAGGLGGQLRIRPDTRRCAPRRVMHNRRRRRRPAVAAQPS